MPTFASHSLDSHSLDLPFLGGLQPGHSLRQGTLGTNRTPQLQVRGDCMTREPATAGSSAQAWTATDRDRTGEAPSATASALVMPVLATPAQAPLSAMQALELDFKWR